MSTPVNTIELEIARILDIFDRQCERFKVDKTSETTPRKEVAAAENSEANGDSRKTTQG